VARSGGRVFDIEVNVADHVAYEALESVNRLKALEEAVERNIQEVKNMYISIFIKELAIRKWKQKQ
jgi:hypothetical protein